MARMRLLDLARPFASILPEVEVPYQKVDQTEKLAFTVCSAVLFILLAEVPIFGTPERADPIKWIRAGLGMSHGTLAELGIVPIVLSGMSFQILAGLRKISVSLDLRSDRALFQSAQKLGALLISFVMSVLLALSYHVSSKATVMIVAQLFVGSCAIIYMDEILSKEYGVVTGSVLFTLVSATQKFAWSALSPETVLIPGRDSTLTYGALPSFFFNIRNRSLKFSLNDFAFRIEAPNLLDLIVAVGVFLLTLYLGMIRLNLQVRSTKMRAQSSTFPIRLAYAGAQPVMFALSTLAAYLLSSYAVSNAFGPSFLLSRIFGAWDPVTGQPVSGLAKFMVPHLDSSILVNLVRCVMYIAIMGPTGAYIGNVWTQSSGFAPQDIAKIFKENSLVLVGKRDVSAVKELRRVVPLAATLGGLATGLLVAVADLIGTNGWGATMSVAAMGVFTIFEQLASEGLTSPNALQGLA